MAKAKEETPLPMPAEGGSYSRDPKTGELTRIDDDAPASPPPPVSEEEK